MGTDIVQTCSTGTDKLLLVRKNGLLDHRSEAFDFPWDFLYGSLVLLLPIQHIHRLLFFVCYFIKGWKNLGAM